MCTCCTTRRAKWELDVQRLQVNNGCVPAGVNSSPVNHSLVRHAAVHGCGIPLTVLSIWVVLPDVVTCAPHARRTVCQRSTIEAPLSDEEREGGRESELDGGTENGIVSWRE